MKFSDDNGILEMAKQYKVKVEFPKKLPRGSKAISEGPYGHAVDLLTRTLYLERRITGAHVEEPYLDVPGEIEVHLHELVHIITHPPFYTIDDVPEEWMLMQFERAVARHCFSSWVVPRVIEWQRSTGVGSNPLRGKEFAPGILAGQDHNLNPMWRDGYRRARCVGLLDERNHPTGCLPDWSKLPKELML